VKGLAASLVLSGFLAGCQTTPPLHEYTIARTALEAARRIEAVRVAPAFFHKAEEAYRKAEVLFKKEDYSEARDGFVVARDYAEKAENSARLQKNDGG
jgi:hypothetical protein